MIKISTFNKKDNEIAIEIINEILKDDNIKIKYTVDKIEIYDEDEDIKNEINIEDLINIIIEDIKDNYKEDIIDEIIKIRNNLYYKGITYNKYIKVNKDYYNKYFFNNNKYIKINNTNINKEINSIKEILISLILHYKNNNNLNKHDKKQIKTIYKEMI